MQVIVALGKEDTVLYRVMDMNVIKERSTISKTLAYKMIKACSNLHHALSNTVSTVLSVRGYPGDVDHLKCM